MSFSACWRARHCGRQLCSRNPVMGLWSHKQLCYYCREPDHRVQLCPSQQKKPGIQGDTEGTLTSTPSFGESLSPKLMSHLWLICKVQIHHSESVFCSYSPDWLWSNLERYQKRQLKLPPQALQHPLGIRPISGSPIGRGNVTHCTELLHLQVSALHQEYPSLLITITMSMSQPLILGFPWMQPTDILAREGAHPVVWSSAESIVYHFHVPLYPPQALKTQGPRATLLSPKTTKNSLRCSVKPEPRACLHTNLMIVPVIFSQVRLLPTTSFIHSRLQKSHWGVPPGRTSAGYICPSMSPALVGWFFV